MNWKFILLITALFSSFKLSANAAAFDLGPSSLPVVLVPGFNHADIVLPITGTAGGFNFSTLQVTSDSTWVAPQVDAANQQVVLRFTTSTLTNSSYTATISATHGANTDTVFVNATLGVRNIFKLLDDPVRSRMYGIQLNGVNRGAIAVIDPLTGDGISSVTVGNKPTGMAVSNDGSELFVINAVDKTISVVNLSTLILSQTLLLPSFDNSGAADTTANIGVGPANILYYTDGAWAPLLRVYNRSTGLVIQTVSIDGPSSGYGFGDFALNSSQTQLLGWAQYGWSAGWAGSYIGKFSVASNGLLTFIEKTSSTYPTILMRDPLETPVLISGGGDKAFVKQLMVNPATIGTVDRSFSGPVYSISPGGEIAVTTNAIFQTSTGNKLYDLPITTSIHAITSDYSRLVYYNTATRTFTSLDLIAAIGSEVMGRTLSPADGSIVVPPSSLNWAPLPGAASYRVYLGSSSAAVTSATTASPEFLGTTTLPDFALTTTLTASVTYYWRVDALVGGAYNVGTVYSFTVSPISSSLSKVETTTVQGHAEHRVTVALTSLSTSVAWAASANQSWVSFASNAGVTPSNLEIILDVSTLPTGVHLATVTLSDSEGTLFTLPVKLTVEPLAVKILKSDPASSKVYAISENTAVTGAKAYLLEIDSDTEAIQRVTQVGNSVTDLAIHNPENRIYIPNWMPGSLLALNKTTLALEHTYAFTPFAGVGSGSNDVYRVSAGAAGRIVVEEQDQSVDLSIFNTSNGAKLGTIGLREGGGGFDPTGRYYYHGENNSSGAKIYKLDVTGDVFTSLANIRVSSYSYYGSRVVVVSENGNGVFWNGSYFDSNLVEQWTMSAETYSTTPDARLAFGDTKIFDTVSKQQVLSMPLVTRVSTYNSTSKKLLVQNSDRLRFYAVQLPLSLPDPVLSAGAITQTSIALSWTDESLETGFTLQRRIAGGTTWTNLTPTINANQTTFTTSGLTSDTVYEFRIKADAPTVSSGWSPVISVKTLAPPPPTVTLISAAMSGSSVALSFSTSANPTNVVIERALADTGPWGVLSTVSGVTTSYLDTAILPLTTYFYRLKAIRDNFESAYTDVGSVTTPAPAAPASPTGFALATISATQIALRWNDTTLESGYLLSRRLVGDTSWTLIATLPANDNSYTDTTVQSGSTYQYRLSAFNIAGSSVPVLTSAVTAIDLTTLMEDDFEPDLDQLVWSHTSVASSINGGQGFNGTNALWFGHAGTRSATTNPVSIVSGARLTFDLRAGNIIADGFTYWDNSEFGEGILLEYSLDGIVWTVLQTISTEYPAYSTWESITVALPNASVSSNTQFRWRQQAHSGANFDTWAIDNLQIQSSTHSSVFFVEQPSPDIVLEGSSKTLTAQLNQTGFRFQWYKDDVLIPGATQSSYVITSSRPSHSGLYHCRASSESMILESEKVMFGVIQPVGYSSQVLVREGSDFALSVRVFPASLASQISYEWYRLIEGDLSGIGTVTGEATPTLRVAGVTKDAVGNYYCYLSYEGVYTLDVGPYVVSVLSAPDINPISDETFVVGQNVVIPITVSDLNATITVAGLPSGLRFNPVSKRIVGIPTVAKSSLITVNARNPYGSAVPEVFELVTVPFPSVLTGSYQGIIESSSDSSLPNGGQLTFQVSASGVTSIVVTLGAETFRLRSTVQVQVGDTDGLLKASIKRKSSTSLTFEVLLNSSAAQFGSILDEDAQQIAGIQTVKNVWTKSNQTSESGVYNVALTPDSEAAHPDHPMGRGFVTLTNSAIGRVRCAGRMADGEVITASSIMGADIDIPLYQSLYRAKGSVYGWVHCESDDASGSLRWAKDDHSTRPGIRLYKSGIPAHSLYVTGGRYVRPAIGTPLIPGLTDSANNAMLRFDEGALPASHEQIITLTNRQTVERPPLGVANPRDVRLVLNAATGRFSGSFVMRDTNPINVNQTLTRKVSFFGCLIPGYDIGLGYFLLPELPNPDIRGSSLSNTPIWSGAVELIPVY